VQVGPGDRVGHLSNCSFDATTFEIWAPLLNGGCVVGIDRDTVLTPHRFSDFVQRCRLDILFVTTALFNRVAAEAPSTFAPLRVLLFGGEAADPTSVRAVLAAGAPEHLVHVYGPTECTTFATWHEIEHVAADATTVSIGGGTSGMSVHVLDRRLRPVAVGAVGELCLGGSGLAHGYLGRAAATAERFVPANGGQRWYRTGDLVRVTACGIEYVGRRDQQVKVRGFRVELGEIERIVLEHELVDACVVVAPVAHDGDRELVVYAASASASGDRLVDDVVALLRHRLPRYLQPSAVVAVPKLPINRNGKIDREALPAPSAGRRPVPIIGVVRPRTATEHAVAAIWCEVLDRESVGVDDDFFELGGHSLRATQLLSRIQRDLGAELDLREIFDSPTVAEIAALIDANDHGPTGDHRIVPVRREPRRLASATEAADPGQRD
jgi:acyl-coenzyme A synthetase/AMP-(fatty) acid ligase/acyl carrier protein